MPTRELLVSVIIPTYNRLPLLRQAVDSVVGQTYAHWELIVVDDGSTDETPAFLSGIPDERVRVISHAHCGNPARLRNVGLATARGALIAFLDSDDLWVREKLEMQIRALASQVQARWSYGGFLMIDEAGQQIAQRAGPPYTPCSGWILDKLVAGNGTAAMVTVLVERALLDEVGPFDEALLFRDDCDLVLRLAARGQALALAAPLAYVREHPHRSTNARSDLHYRMLAVYEKLRASSDDPRVNGLCQRQCARVLIDLARAHGREGERWQSLKALGAAFRFAQADPGLWPAMGKTAICSFLPSALFPARRSVHGTPEAGR